MIDEINGASQEQQLSEEMSNGGVNRVTRQPSSYITRRIESVFHGLPTDELKQNFAVAMVMSANLGSLELARPCHPEQIYKRCRLKLDIQRSYGIILSKDDALEFLTDFCAVDISETSFKRLHTRKTYFEKFNRECLKVGKRRMLCTYAEWLYLHDHTFEPELPRYLIDLLPEDWELPTGG
ncbi:hypothetical protein [Leptothoe kymatousa]|uniref:Uncharacterized protein n=1 Tax=Leptothoe kymatousa TAU-MAC 1615 TaxID=2364775 RepID=A0ABS5XZU7_9CYAN|nr:hypothetical protein [Leptothoe kymatousa]MBT9310891.1 hypothetical protein [Leptothoe kymatousa TAU-MAC 1615]